MLLLSSISLFLFSKFIIDVCKADFTDNSFSSANFYDKIEKNGKIQNECSNINIAYPKLVDFVIIQRNNQKLVDLVNLEELELNHHEDA